MADDIQKLKNDIALNQVVIFIGTGVSVYTTKREQEVSHWRGLLKDGLQRCQQSGYMEEEEFKAFSDTLESDTADVDSYLDIADIVKYYLKLSSDLVENEIYNKWFKKTVGKLSVKNPDLVKSIGELGCPILTTNYDLLLERILDRKPLTWNEYQTFSMNDSLEVLKNYILHLQGYFEEPDGIIFSRDDYNRMYDNNLEESNFRTLLETKTLLFIGFDVDIVDVNLSNLLKWITHLTDKKPLSIYKLVSSTETKIFKQSSDVSCLTNIKEIQYDRNLENLLQFIRNLKSFTPLIRDNLSLTNKTESIRKKYLNYLIDEYGHVSILGQSDSNVSLPLESVYVKLKFDPTHLSIRAMKMLDINEEFERKLSSAGFFTETERRQLNRAIVKKKTYNPQVIYRDFMVDQWLNVLLSNTNIFTASDATAIKNKVNQLKQDIFEKHNLKEAKQYEITQAYSEFRHFIILGHPGSGKTTISKWLVMNMAKQCLNENSMVVANRSFEKEKLPILIPIWKYVDQLKDNRSGRKRTLLEFIYENPTLSSTCFTDEEQKQLSFLVREALVQGNVLVIFEGLDEVPAHVDRSDLMKEINTLLERGIDYDVIHDKLTYSVYEKKEINNTKDPLFGNRFIITSRIEGNYFEDINFYIPRLIIEDMTNDALKLFCNSYMKYISTEAGRSTEEYNMDQLYDAITQNKDIFHLAINPQLASVVAGVYTQYDDKLPEKRIDLYEKAIEKMIERLVFPCIDNSVNYVSKEFGLNSTLIWSIMQEIAEYLHSKVEGLSEKVLQETIRKCLIDYQTRSSENLLMSLDDFVAKLVDIFKYQAGLFNEFGQNSFRFIHRTFQEYLAAKSIIYSNGSERSEDMIYEIIKSRIGIPNWRVPLSMTFGILSKLSQHNGLFNNILMKLLKNEETSSNTRFSTLLLPFVIVDSLNDMYFSSDDIECKLIRKLADMLLLDYSNMCGFSRLKEHQELIHSYFLKLKIKYDKTMTKWFIEKINHEETVAPCANIICQLKWYNSIFHKIFLKNLHTDSIIWNWPIDSILHFYSNEINAEAVLTQLKFKNALMENPEIIHHITTNKDWLCLIVALYGGYKNYNTPKIISEYNEICQYLSLSENQRAPFVFYYQEIWGRDDTDCTMAMHANRTSNKEHWKEHPIFDKNDIYKESFLTDILLELLKKEKSTTELIEYLRKQMNSQNLNTSEKTEALLALIVLGEFDFVNDILKEEKTMIKCFGNRIEQIICILKDPIARSSSYITKYLLEIYDGIKANEKRSNLKFSDYCKIYLSIIANSGGLPIDTTKLAEAVDDNENKYSLYAEYFAFNCTGFLDDFQYNIAVLSDRLKDSGKTDQIMKSFLKIGDAVQLYRPVRAYPWPIDIFYFLSSNDDDIPIALFNCLENVNANVPYVLQIVSEIFINEGYFTRNQELIPLVILFHFGIMSGDTKRFIIYKKLLPELIDQVNIKEFLFGKIQLLSNPYYKSRALYQLAEFYDEKSFELLNQSFTLRNDVQDPILKFQILEKIFNIVHCKDIEQKLFIRQIVEELILTFDTIEGLNDRFIASVRLSFYGSGEFRKNYLTIAVETLSRMSENDDKIKFIIKLKSLVSIYDDLQNKLDDIIESLQNKIHSYFINSYYGRILFTEQLNFDTSNSQLSIFDTAETNDVSNNNEIQALFLLYAQLNDIKSSIGKTENLNHLWIKLYNDPNNQTTIEKVLKIALDTELLLTPQAAIIIDELVQNGKEDNISILFPYIIKPSNEVLPIVYRWFTNSNSTEIKKLAALLLSEAKHVFEPFLDTIIELIKSDNDQMRYRAQRIFQHPDRDVQEPVKRISVIGEKTLIKILQNRLCREHLPRVRTYLNSFFFDLLWDDPIVFQNLHKSIKQLKETNSSNGRKKFFFDKIKFIDTHTWNALMESLQSSYHPAYAEELFHSVMTLTQVDQITEEQWTAFVQVLSAIDISQFQEKIFFICTDVEIVEFIIQQICTLPISNDETYFELLESKLIHDTSVRIENILQSHYQRIKHIGRCNFYGSKDSNQTVLNTLSLVSINMVIMESLIQWLIQNMAIFRVFDYAWLSIVICDSLLLLVSACAQKEDYMYRRITNSPNFNKIQMIKLLEKMLNYHPFFSARGNAFILLAAIDHSDHRVIINAMNALLDENLVKEYSVIGIPLINLSPNDYLDGLLESLKNESAIKAYEIVKVFTQFALNEKISEHSKSKIMNYLANEIGQLKSKKPVNYYYTDIKIPFTTTLENELYKAWIKIQGLSGKTQYSIGFEE
ncbi:unnamed protein product [Rotaria magnacalcarata]